jgi:hypothetical protein
MALEAEQLCGHSLCSACCVFSPLPATAGSDPLVSEAREEREARSIVARYLWPALESAVGSADTGRALGARLAHLADLEEARVSSA